MYCAFVGYYFPLWINTHLTLQWAFTTAGRCIWDQIKIHYSAHVHGNEETCHPLQCRTFVCSDNTGAVRHRGIRFTRHTGSTYLWDCLVFSWDLIYIKKNEERFHRMSRLWVPGTRSPECQLKYYERQCFVHTRIHSNQREILLWRFRAAVISRGNWVITIVH